MPNAPYVNPPVNPQVMTDADGYYFGWMGLAQDATFRANMALIVTAGVKNALIDPAVIAAFTLAIKNALIDPAVIAADTLGTKNALIDPAVIAAETTAIVNAITQLVTNDVVPSEDDYRRWVALIAMASSAVRKSGFMSETSAAEFLDLKNRVIQMKNDVLVP